MRVIMDFQQFYVIISIAYFKVMVKLDGIRVAPDFI